MASTFPDAPLALGIDLGSHGIRCHCADLVVRADFTGPPPPAQRDASVISAALDQCLAELPSAYRARIGAVAVTGVRGTVLPLDARGRPVGPMRADFDPDCRADARDLARRYGPDLVARTGCPAFPLSGLPKIMALARSGAMPDRITTAQDYVATLLTGNIALSQGAALRLGVLNATGTGFELALLDELGIPGHLFAPLVPIGSTIGQSRHPALPPGIPVIAAPGDGPSARLALAAHPEDGVISLGTTTVVLLPAPVGPPPEAERLTVEFDGVGGRLFEFGSGIGGIAIDWLSRLTGQTPAALAQLAETADPGGIRADLRFVSAWQDAPGATLSGLPPDAGLSEIAAAFFDALAEDAVTSVTRLRAMGALAGTLHLTGGGAHAARLVAGLARGLGTVPTLPIPGELAAAGAARLATAHLAGGAPDRKDQPQ